MPRVLLIDPDRNALGVLQAALGQAGFKEIAAVTSGSFALTMLERNRPDLIVSRVGVPDIDGYELIRDLNREPATCDLPVVVLTTRAGAKHVNLARELGVEHYVAKPVDETSFVQLIESLTVPAPARTGS